jgi:hypothetical protein
MAEVDACRSNCDNVDALSPSLAPTTRQSVLNPAQSCAIPLSKNVEHDATDSAQRAVRTLSPDKSPVPTAEVYEVDRPVHRIGTHLSMRRQNENLRPKVYRYVHLGNRGFQRGYGTKKEKLSTIDTRFLDCRKIVRNKTREGFRYTRFWALLVVDSELRTADDFIKLFKYAHGSQNCQACCRTRALM